MNVFFCFLLLFSRTSLNKESVSQNNGNTISVVIENRCVDTAPVSLYKIKCTENKINLLYHTFQYHSKC